MKNSIILFLFLIPAFLFAQYPTTGNKSRLGWQTTGDGLIWRGVAGDTVNKPNNRNYPYFQLDTVNAVLYRYIQTKQQWQPVSGAVDIDSLIYATRFWVNSNFFPLQGGTLTGTGGNGFVGFPVQSSPPATPATGFSLFAGSTGNNISWMQPDGFFRRLVSPVTGTPRQYQFMARSYTLADSADVANNVTSIAANYLATSNGTNLVARNLFDNNTYVGVLNNKPFSLGQWTTAGRPSGTSGYMGWNTTLTGLDWYNGTRWATGLESTFARGTATYVPFFDANGQITQGVATGQGLRYYNAGGNLHILEAKSAFIAQGVTGINSGNADLATRTATGNGYWSFSANESTGAFSFYDAISNQTPVTIAKNSGANRITTNSTTTTLSSTTLLSLTSATVSAITGSNTLSAGSLMTDALASSQASFRTVNGSNILSWSPFSTSPYLAVSNGTQQGYFQATTLDGIRFGSASAHPLIFNTTATERARFTAGGNLLIGTATDVSRRLHVSGEARITDLTTDTPTRIVGADADGDLGALGLSNLSITSGSLTAQNIGNTDLTLTGSRILNSGGFPLRLAPNTTIGGTLKVASLTNHANPDSIVTTVAGVLGKKKFLKDGNNYYDGTTRGFYSNNGYTGFDEFSGTNYTGFHAQPEYYEVTSYRSSGSDYSSMYGGLSGTGMYNTIEVDYGSNNGQLTLWNDIGLRLRWNTGSGAYNIFTVDIPGTAEFGRYGAGNKEAGDLSKTASAYLAGFATDGTLLDYPISSLATTWLKTELEASRDVDITGGTNTDFRLRSNTRTQFDGKFKLGSDSTFVHDPSQDTTYAKGTVRIKSGSLILQNETGGAYMTIQAQGSGNKEAGILMESRGVFGNVLYINGESLSTFGIYNFDKVGGGGLNMSTGESPGFTGMASYGDFYVVDSTSTSAGINRRFSFDSRGTTIFHSYGTPATTAAALSKTLSNYGVGFATDGTVTSREIKRDTTIYVDDADYDWSAAITTSQIASRFNRVIFWMTTTAAAGSDSELTLHTPDANLLQVEYLIHSVDEPAGFDNKIVFGTNNAVDSTNGLVTNYYPAAGDGIHVRAGLRSGVYKYRYSN